MTRVLVLAEGQTEEVFIRSVLGPVLEARGTYLVASVIRTGRNAAGKPFKGGLNGFVQLERNIRNLLGDRGAKAVTTMIDYYGLPKDFPGLGAVAGNCYQRVELLSKALEDHFRNGRFKPYISLHEFEAMILADPSKMRSISAPESVVRSLVDVVSAVASPEEVNDGPESHPSARLASLLPAYDKPTHGSVLAQRIGLETIRRRCPHFNRWVAWLESL